MKITVACRHSTETVEFRYGFKLLRLALRFHIFLCRYSVNATPKRKKFVPFSNTAGIVLTGSYSRFQVTFQSAFPKFVYITKSGILRENVQSEICMLVI